MKVLIVSPCWGSFGGVESFIFQLARALTAEHDIEPRICFKRVAAFRMQPSLEAAMADARDIEFQFVDRASKGLIDAIRESDLVHSQNTSIDVAVAAALFRKPHVMTIFGWRRPEFTARLLLNGLAARLADRRWYISDFVWSTWEPDRHRAGSGKLPIVSNLPMNAVEPSARRGFIFVGRWVPNKGIEVLIEAYANASLDRNRWPLTLVGDGPLRGAVEARIALLGIKEIITPGFVNDQTRNDLIRHAKWMVTPPHTREELGLTPIEARHVGVPCIVTRDGGLLEAAGIFSLNCEPANADQLRQLLEYASGMSDMAYEKLADATQQELKGYLKPLTVYARAYRELLGAREHEAAWD